MPRLQHIALTIEADADGDGTVETGIFEMALDVEIAPSISPQLPVDGLGSSHPSDADPGTAGRQGYTHDVGAGEFAIDISFQSWEGATDYQHNPLQWGDDAGYSHSQTSATGRPPLTQISVLNQYLLAGRTDSRTPATLEYGERHEHGLFDPLDVAVTGLTNTRAAADGQQFSGSLTCVAIRDEDDTGDARAQHDW